MGLEERLTDIMQSRQSWSTQRINEIYTQKENLNGNLRAPLQQYKERDEQSLSRGGGLDGVPLRPEGLRLIWRRRGVRLEATRQIYRTNPGRKC